MGCRHRYRHRHDRYCMNCGKYRSRTKSKERKTLVIILIGLVVIGGIGGYLANELDLFKAVNNEVSKHIRVNDTTVTLNLPDLDEVGTKIEDSLHGGLNATQRAEKRYQDEKERSMESIHLINAIRRSNGMDSIQFDARAFDLALARVNDLKEYDYFKHTNPFTGTCPDNMKFDYGFGSNEYPAENLGMSGGYLSHEDAIEMWMGSQGHKRNLLWPTHISGAIACESGYCSFLGVNQMTSMGAMGVGCY